MLKFKLAYSTVKSVSLCVNSKPNGRGFQVYVLFRGTCLLLHISECSKLERIPFEW